MRRILLIVLTSVVWCVSYIGIVSTSVVWCVSYIGIVLTSVVWCVSYIGIVLTSVVWCVSYIGIVLTSVVWCVSYIGAGLCCLGYLSLHRERQGCRGAGALVCRWSGADRGSAQVHGEGGAGQRVCRHRQDCQGRGEPRSDHGPRRGASAGSTH